MSDLTITIILAIGGLVITIIGFFLKQSVFTEMEDTKKQVDLLRHHVGEQEKETHKSISQIESSLATNYERDRGDEKARSVELSSIDKRLEKLEADIRILLTK